MKNNLVFIFLTLFVLAMVLPSKAAEAPKLISSHGDWNVYSFMDNKDKVCFMSSQPYKKEGKYKKRGEVFMFITSWSSNKDKNVVSISNGYTFKGGSTVVVKVDKKSFKMFTQGEMAWTKNQNADNALTQKIRQGSSLSVSGFSKYGTKTTDTYSLKGSGSAYKALVRECK